MKIAILEKTNFNKEQIEKLKKVGEVDFYDNLSQEQANVLAPQYDIVVVNWLDPTPFLLNMKQGSLVALLSTGYGWITNINEAMKKQIYVSNIPNYSTEAVAEHLLGLLLGVSKNIFPTLNNENNGVVGFELKNKTVGIIGLGDIGLRFAEIMNFFGSNIITNNRNNKNNIIAQDVSLDHLLSHSDIICITCSVNSTSQNLINASNYEKIKKGAVIIGSTWGIIDETIIDKMISENIVSNISLDAAIEANSKLVNDNCNKERIFFTPHIAYNTKESEMRQLDICVDNIVSFINGEPKNIVNNI
ncbi:MAG: hypothetical protein HFJ97_02725 [Eubacterium sp.]|nr:hypothetical protein [Clostridia bacterium]MCI9145261.1 hypothetical protein [Eubacterium sp.]